MTAKKSEHILVFGGSFDPPHRAHIELPLHVAATLGVDRLIFIPASVSPHKTDAPPVDSRHRIAMLRCGLDAATPAGSMPVDISLVEIERDGPSYFVDTLEQLKRAYPNAQFSFLMGSDQLRSFTRWKDWQQILERAEPVVMLRPPESEATLVEELAPDMNEKTISWWLDHIIDAPRINVSSTKVREVDSAGAGHAVDVAIDAYIKEHSLYGKS